MASPLSEAHIEALRRLRVLTTTAVETIWSGLPGYDRENIDEWLTLVLPVVDTAKRTSIALTDAYLAAALERQPLGVDQETVLSEVRNGVAADEVYQRPFVTVWTALKEGVAWPDAVGAGSARAASAAAADVQLAMRSTLREVGEADDGIFGYERVPDGHACPLCLIASTQRYHTSQLMPIHNHCGCGVEPITDPAVGRVINRDRYRALKRGGEIDRLTAQRRAPRARERAAANRDRAEATRREAAAETDPQRRARLEERAASWDRRAEAQDAMADGTRVAVREHGELGPVLVNADHDFTTAALALS